MRLWVKKWRKQDNNRKIQCLYTAVNIFWEIHVCRQGRKFCSEIFGWYDLLQGNFFWCGGVHHHILFTSLHSGTSPPLDNYKSSTAVSMNVQDRKSTTELPASFLKIKFCWDFHRQCQGLECTVFLWRCSFVICPSPSLKGYRAWTTMKQITQLVQFLS